MKSKLQYLIENSLNKKIKTKWFKVVNIILAILIICLCNIDRIITSFGGDFDKPKNVIIVSDETYYSIFSSYFEENKKMLGDIGEYKLKNSNENIENLIKKIDDKTFVINIKEDFQNIIAVDLYADDQLNTIDKQLFQVTLNGLKSTIAVEKLNLTDTEIMQLSSPVNFEVKITNPDNIENQDAKDLVSSGIITIFIVPIFLLVILLVQMLGTEINEEKTTRGMEIIISSVPVKDHFISKIVASLKYVLIQGGLVLGYGVIGVIIRLVLNKISGKVVLSGELLTMSDEVVNLLKGSGILKDFLIALPIILVLMIVSFLIYSIIAAVLASVTTSNEDYQQLQTPLTLIMVFGYYIAIMAAVFDGSLFIKIMAFVPMVSFLVAPSIYLLGQLSIIELLLSTIISFVLLFVVYYYGLKIYKDGILNYSSSNLWQKILKSLKK